MHWHWCARYVGVIRALSLHCIGAGVCARRYYISSTGLCDVWVYNGRRGSIIYIFPSTLGGMISNPVLRVHWYECTRYVGVLGALGRERIGGSKGYIIKVHRIIVSSGCCSCAHCVLPHLGSWVYCGQHVCKRGVQGEDRHPRR